MTSQTLNGQQRSVRHRGAGLFVVLGLVAFGVLGFPEAASAAPFGILTTPGTLFPGLVTITGEKDAASTVDVGPQGGGAPYCSIPAGAETWSCDVTLPDGNHTLDAIETAPDATTSTLSLPFRVLGAPVITTTGLTSGSVNGTGFPGAGIEISGTATTSCGVVLPNGSWSCALPGGTGTYSVIATQTWANVPSEPGGSTAPVRVEVDADPPTAPAFSTPTPDSRVTSQPTAFSGSGENGGRVEVFVDTVRVCVSPVVSGAWTCSAPLSDGQHAVQAVQWDAAGNPSGPSSAFTITAGAVATAPVTPTVPRNPSAPSAPLTPDSGADRTVPPPPVGGSSGMPPFDTWELPTDYGAAIPSAATTNGTSWLLGLGLGLSFALLVALPLRLLVTTFRRKRAYVPRSPRDDEEPLLSPRVTAALFLGAAVLLAALAGGIQAEVRYLRLVIAIGLALAVLNGVAVLAAKLVGRSIGVSTGIRLAPVMLAIAAATALVSRVAGIQPPIIVGIVLAVRFAPAVAARARGIVSLVEISAIVVLGFVAWLAQSALGPVNGFLPSLASESLSALTIAALGSAMVMLLPVNRMPGRLVWVWSRSAWAALTLVTATVSGVVIAGGSGFPVAWLLGGSLVFAAVSVGAWAWVHFVEPQFAVGGPS